MKIIIDGDGCPFVNTIYDIAQDNKIKCVIVTDTAHEFNKFENKITVETGNNAADYKIISLCEINDIVITCDTWLADVCKSKGCKVISPYGEKISSRCLDKKDKRKHLQDFLMPFQNALTCLL